MYAAGRVAGEEHAGLAVANGDQHLAGTRERDPATDQIGHDERHGRDDVEAALGGGQVQREAEDRLEVGEPVGAAQVHLVAVEHEPHAERQRLRDDREVHAADPAAKREIPERQAEEPGDEHDGGERERAALKRPARRAAAP